MIIHYERDKRHDFLRRSFWKGEITKRNGKIHKAAQILFKDTVPVLGGGGAAVWLATYFTELRPLDIQHLCSVLLPEMEFFVI